MAPRNANRIISTANTGGNRLSVSRAAAIALVAGLALSGCGTTSAENPPKPEVTQPVETEKPTSLQAELDQNMETFHALERGSEEWKAYFAEFELPAASETDPAVIAEKFSQGLLVDLPKKIIANAPGGGKDDLEANKTPTLLWMKEGAKIGEERSIATLIQQLDVEKHLRGFFDTTYGSSWEKNPVAIERFSTLLNSVDEIVSVLLMDGEPNSQLSYEPTSLDVIFQSEKSITVFTSGTLTVNSEIQPKLSGDSTFEVQGGRWIGVPQK